MENHKAWIDRVGGLLNGAGLETDEGVVEQADHLVKHEFNVLGSGWVHNRYGMKAAGFEGRNYSDASVSYEKVRATVPEWYRARQAGQMALRDRFVPGFAPIDWQIDIKSGGRYDIVHVKDIKFGVLEGLDAKISADMSRGYHLVVLARAWRKTGRARYRDEAVSQILDWMTVSPPEYGAGWRANMNVAIRVVNWLAACSILSPGLDASDPSTKAFLDILQESLIEHRRYIGRFLEFTELPNSLHPNHYIANLAGLLVLCAFLRPFDPEALPWEILAKRELGITMRWQINPDGLDFEGTTMYHAFALEMLSLSLIMAARMDGARAPAAVRDWIGARFREDFPDLLHRMFAGLRDLIQPNRRMPVVGDADSGRFLCLERTPAHDTERVFLTGVGAALFHGAELLPPVFRPEDAAAATALFDDAAVPAAGTRRAAESVAFRDTGFYVMKTGDAYVFISCGQIGTGGLGSHAHNDRLEVLLTVHGRDIVIDPGVYAYTASRKYRDLYRNVEAHATVRVDGKQPNRLNPPGCWWGYLDDTRCRCLEWTASGDRAVFAGEHYGYRRLETPVTHRRRVASDGGTLGLTDTLAKPKNAGDEMPVDFRFMLGGECGVSVEGKNAVIRSGDVTVRAVTREGRWVTEEGFYAPMYGLQAPTVVLALRFDRFLEGNEIVFSW